MSADISDREQIEMIKTWWRENGKFTLVSIVVALLLSIGWHYWQNRKNQEASTSSLLYEQMLTHEANQELSDVEYDVTSLLTNHSHTPYAALGAFISAQNAINKNKYDFALERLNWVIDHSSNKDFVQIAKIRKARILLEMKKYDEALNTLSKVSAESYLSLINEVKGDIKLAKGDKVQARFAYQNALRLLSSDAPNRSLLQMKYDQLRD